MIINHPEKCDLELIDNYSQSLYLQFQKDAMLNPPKWIQFLNALNSHIEIEKLGNFYFENEDCFYTKLGNSIVIINKNGFSKGFKKSFFQNLQDILLDPELDMIITLWPSQNFINFLFMKGLNTDTLQALKIIRFPQGKIPIYFLEIIENYYNNQISELLEALVNIKELEKNFSDYLINYLSQDRALLSVHILIISILLYLSEFPEFLPILSNITYQYSNQKTLEIKRLLGELKDIEIKISNKRDLSFLTTILTPLVKNDSIINLTKVQEILSRYPFSINEPTTFLQEIAITPFILSKIVEEFSISKRKKKKQGIYFTPLNEAEFVSRMILFRYLQHNYGSINTIDLAKILFQLDFELTDIKINKKNSSLMNSPVLRILDPASGSGTFLIMIIKLLVNLLIQKSIEGLTEIQVYGTEKDFLVYTVCQIRFIFLNIAYKQKKININIDFSNINNEDFIYSKKNLKFDIIVGNPPWVRHEDINLATKNDLFKKLQMNYKELSLNKKSDLYIYFCIFSLDLLIEGGILGLLISNAWIEVNYGITLQSYLLSRDSNIETFEIIYRSNYLIWKNLGINSVLLIAEKSREPIFREVKGIFTETKNYFWNIPIDSLMKGILSKNNYLDKFYRTEVVLKKELLKTSKWAGNFLRASRSERRLLAKINKKGKNLSAFCTVYFGIKTGANDFFYLQPINRSIIDQDVIEVTNKTGFRGPIEKKYLKPLIKTPMEVNGFIIPNGYKPRHYIFYCNDTINDLDCTSALKYIKWGEEIKITVKQGRFSGLKVKGFHSLKSIKNRKFWYTIGDYLVPDLLWTKSYHNKPGCFVNEAQFFPDQRFYSVSFSNKSLMSLTYIYLNSSFIWAQMELFGNTNMGFGVLDTNVYWLKSLKIPIGLNKSLKYSDDIKFLTNELKKQNKRYIIHEKNDLKEAIDIFFLKYFGLNKKDLELLYSLISRLLSNRIKI